MSDNKSKTASTDAPSEPSFFKSRIFISLVLAVVFFLMGYVFAQSPKSSKGGKSKNPSKKATTGKGKKHA